MHSRRHSVMQLRSAGEVILLASVLQLLIGCESKGPQTATERTPSGAAPAVSSGSTDIQKQHQEADQQLRPEIEEQRKESQKQAEKTVDQEAIAAVQETEAAIKAIAANKKDDALKSIENATGKINVLLARNSASALIPVSVDVVLIDTAPSDIKTIEDVTRNASAALKSKDLPLARMFLEDLISEIRIRTTALPLATYPAALTQAARLLDEGQMEQAGTTLLTAVNTLAIIEHAIPVPVLLAQAAVKAANVKQQQDKAAAATLLETAKSELERSRALGYLSNDSEYSSLEKDITSLEAQVKGTADTGSAFSKLRDRIAAFLERQKNHERR